MKKYFSFYLLFFSLFLYESCDFNKLKNNNPNSDQLLEIEFQKEGELSLINGNEEIKKLDIEIASDDYEKENGLMYRSKMEENRGMIFLFDNPKIQTFWMKNTRIPLDIIYISESKTVINIAKNTEPFKESGVPPSYKPAKYVLEVNGGSSDKWGIKENITKIDFKTIK